MDALIALNSRSRISRSVSTLDELSDELIDEVDDEEVVERVDDEHVVDPIEDEVREAEEVVVDNEHDVNEAGDE